MKLSLLVAGVVRTTWNNRLSWTVASAWRDGSSSCVLLPSVVGASSRALSFGSLVESWLMRLCTNLWTTLKTDTSGTA